MPINENAIAAQDRYLGTVQRLQLLLAKAHHNLAATTDLDALDDAADLLERVMLHGETVRIVSAQSHAAERKRERDAAFAAGAAGGVAGGLPDSSHEGDGEGEGSPDAPEGGTPPEGETSGNAASLVIRGQRPPVAKPGRARGWQGSKARTPAAGA